MSRKRYRRSWYVYCDLRCDPFLFGSWLFDLQNNTREMEHLNRNYRGHVYHIFAGNQDDPEKIMHLLYLLARNEGDFKTIEEELKAILTNKMQDCDDNGKVVLTGLLYYIKKKIGE